MHVDIYMQQTVVCCKKLARWQVGIQKLGSERLNLNPKATGNIAACYNGPEVRYLESRVKDTNSIRGTKDRALLVNPQLVLPGQKRTTLSAS